MMMNRGRIFLEVKHSKLLGTTKGTSVLNGSKMKNLNSYHHIFMYYFLNTFHARTIKAKCDHQ